MEKTAAMSATENITSIREPIVVSAPGKVILFGEHSVVYGKKALAFSLNLRTKVIINPFQSGIELNFSEIDVRKLWSISEIKSLWEKVQNLVEPQHFSNEKKSIISDFLGIKIDGEISKKELGLMAFLHIVTAILPTPICFTAKINSEMPVGAGLGSSGAFGVCLATAFLKMSKSLKMDEYDKISNESLAEISNWAFSCEKVVHGSPSGIDNSICTYGNAVKFHSGKIEKISVPNLKVILVDTGVSRSTKTLVEKVKRKYDKFQCVMDPLLESFDNIVQVAIKALETEDFLTLNELIDMNQSFLNAIDVSHPSLDEIVALAKKHGLHGKLTGAGGGGCAIILLDPSVDEIVVNNCLSDLRNKGFKSMVTNLGGDGVDIHN